MNKIKVRVIKEFPDKYTGKKRVKDEVFEVTGDRLREIRRSGDYVEVVKEDKPEKAPEAKAKK